MPTMGRDRKARRQVIQTLGVVAIIIALALVLFQTSPLIRNFTQPMRAGMDDIVVQAGAVSPALPNPEFSNVKYLQQRVQELESQAPAALKQASH